MTFDLVLQGEYTNTELDDITQLFLSNCKLETGYSNIGEKITHGVWIGKVCAWREPMTTSLLGRHLGHFKALICCHSLNFNYKEGQELTNKQMDLIDAHVALLQCMHGKCYSYKWWKNLVNMVIVKILGINKIHCLRILTLYEADYSIFMGLMWKELIKSSEKRKSINRGLQGFFHASQALLHGKRVWTKMWPRSHKLTRNMAGN
eukprot:15355631-Ditylum_brightwellii.AAC.2